jgi:hypothetical protein
MSAVSYSSQQQQQVKRKQLVKAITGAVEQCVWNYSYLTLMRRFLDLAARHRWSCPNETLCRRAIRV